MKYVFKTDDDLEARQVMKARNMAWFIWELKYNTKKQLEWDIESKSGMTAYDAFDLIYERINELLDQNGIIIDDLTE